MAENSELHAQDWEEFFGQIITALLTAAETGHGERAFTGTLLAYARPTENHSSGQQAYLIGIVAQLLHERNHSRLALTALQCIKRLNAHYTVDQLVAGLNGATLLCAELIKSAELAEAAAVIRDLVTALPAGRDIDLDILSCRALEYIGSVSIGSHIPQPGVGHDRQALETLSLLDSRYFGTNVEQLIPIVAAVQMSCGYLTLPTDVSRARQYFDKASASSSKPCGEISQEEVKALREIGEISRHCLRVIDHLDVPEGRPDLRYMAAADREARRIRRQWLSNLPRNLLTRSRRREYLEAAGTAFGAVSTRNAPRAPEIVAAAHREALRMIRSWACQGDPFVLFLRNFDTSDFSHSDINGVGHVRLHLGATPLDGYPNVYSADGLHDGLLSADIHTVEVANPRGELDLERPGYRLYLGSDDWRTHIAKLIAMAEIIVIKAFHVSAGVVAELELVQEMGRAQDTIVTIPSKAQADEFMEKIRLANDMIEVFANNPFPGKRRRRIGPDVDGIEEFPIPEFFSADHPLLRGPYLRVLQGLAREGSGDPAAEVVSVIAARLGQIDELTPNESLLAYCQRVERGLSSR